jgi:hypothetical protein
LQAAVKPAISVEIDDGSRDLKTLEICLVPARGAGIRKKPIHYSWHDMAALEQYLVLQGKRGVP